jgi:hypothetical protein
VILLGDYNAYLEEDPMGAFEAAGLIVQDRLIPESDRYSYVFDGESGTLDYAITSPSLAVAGRGIWHINSDEPRILDYNTEFNPPYLYSPDAFRCSDHDPVVVGLTLPAAVDVLFSELTEETRALGLSSARRLVLLTAIELAEQAYKLSLELGRTPRLAEAARKVARQQLDVYQAAVRKFVRQGYLTEANAAEVLARAAELRGLI